MTARSHMRFQGHTPLQSPTDSRQRMEPGNQPMLARTREDCRIPGRGEQTPKLALGKRGILAHVCACYVLCACLHVVYSLGLRG